MKEKIITTNDNPLVVIHDVLEGVDENIIQAVGCFETQARTLTNIRDRHINPLPHIYPTLSLSSQISTTIKKQIGIKSIWSG